MSASQIGAYQTASYAFTQRADSGFEAARVRGAQEAPQFKASLNNLQTRVGADETANTNAKGKSGSGKGAPAEGRGKFVDILA